MALRIGLVIGTEFLRLVLRQLLRRQVGVEIVGEVADLAAVGSLSASEWLIVEGGLSASGSLADLCRERPGRVILVGEGADVALPPGLLPGDAILIPAGNASAKFDPSALSVRLGNLLTTLHSAAPLARPAKPKPAENVSETMKARRPALVGISASTGGPEALQTLFTALRPPVCPVVVALHIPREHTEGLARHLADVSGHSVSVGETGLLPERGIVLLQGGADYAVVQTADGLALRRVTTTASSFHPNGDVLLGSMATLNRAVIGLVLTGMGNDGSEGVRALADKGLPVFAQRPSSCAIPGMPSAAIATGGVSEIAPLAGIAARLNDLFALPD
jgi:two-component system chemotaxis response regulator CheB